MSADSRGKNQPPGKTPSPCTLASIGADALSLGRWLALVSLVFCLLALSVLFWRSGNPVSVYGPLLLSVFAAGMQGVFALRVRFDERFFRRWAEQWRGVASAQSPEVTEALREFDEGLALARLRAPLAGEPRPLDERLRAALRLLRAQFVWFSLQCVLLGVATLAASAAFATAFT